MIRTKRRLAALGAALSTLMATGAQAASAISQADLATAETILGQFNAVIYGNLTTGSEIDGRVVVGGNLLSNGNNNQFCHNNCSGDSSGLPNSYGGLTVFGSVGGGNTETVNNGNIYVGGSNANGLELSHNGNAYIAGTNSGKVSDGDLYVSGANSGTVQNGTLHAAVATTTTFPFPSLGSTFSTPLNNLSAALNVQASVAPGSQNGSNFQLNAAATLINGVEVTIYNVAASTLTSLLNPAVNFNGADLIIVNVTGGAGTNLNLSNFNSFAGDDKFLWNFIDATSLNFGTWAGSVLAPNAAVANTNGSMEGDLIAAAFNQGAEVHIKPFTGNLSFVTTSVPEPSTLALFGFGFAGLMIARRRRT